MPRRSVVQVVNIMGEKLTMEQVADGSLAYEAAHNLMQLYAATGNLQMVKRISGWLAI